MDKNKIIAIAITALSTALITWFSAGGCDGPQVQTVTNTVTEVQHDLVQIPGRTVQLPGRIETVLVPAPVDSLTEAFERERAKLHAELELAMMKLSYYESLSAVADTSLTREVVLMREGQRLPVQYTDNLTLEYQFPPVNQFMIRTDTVTIPLPDEVVTVMQGLPWWAEVLIGLGGAVAGALLGK